MSEEKKLNVYEKLLQVQTLLKAPKTQTARNYKYRSCEDILEALKPLLSQTKTTIIINDSMVCEGDRFYIKATVKFIDVDNLDFIEASAYAREPNMTANKMQESQITGASSSYARKYALNGLFAIDDTADMDYLNDRIKDDTKRQKRQSKQVSDDDLWAKAHHERVTGGEFENMTLIEVEHISPQTIDEWYKLANGQKKQMLKVLIDRRK